MIVSIGAFFIEVGFSSWGGVLRPKPHLKTKKAKIIEVGFVPVVLHYFHLTKSRCQKSEVTQLTNFAATLYEE